MTTRMRVLMVATMAVAGSGCALSRSVRRTPPPLAAAAPAIDGNTQAIHDSTAATGNLVPALQGVERLRGPMEAVAALDPTLKGVAALREPMGRWPRSTRACARWPALGTPMSAARGRFVPGSRPPRASGRRWIGWRAMRPSLEAVAGLHDSLDRVAGLDTQLASVAALKGSMDQLGGLRTPMERLAALEEPMTRVAELGGRSSIVRGCS